ncbi:asparaginase [Marinococcus halophilus]|uniref:asparaginase n=1 Tax=Marinococcus halophilus TaxID=1371 RepID=UPI001FD1EE17|nr:asparaginase [Marinococcus halophilus]
MKHVKVIATGGTIASLPKNNEGVSASLSGKELIKKIGIEGDIEVKSSVTLGSYTFDYKTLYCIAVDVIEALKDPNVQGVVITHGTDTMEETAYYLSLVTSNYDKPIVLTGAQLDASHSFSDGAKNLSDAITVAKSEKSIGVGTCVVFGGFIYEARDVHKVDTNALEAFSSPGWGPIGRVDNQKLIFKRSINESIFIPLEVPAPVALVRLGIGLDGEEFKRLTNGYRGVVIQAFGRGNAHSTITEVVKELVSKDIPVIVTSRCIRGSVLPVYSNGGGIDLEKAGAWFAGDLAGEKVRLLLGLLIANKKSFNTMQNILEKVV